MWRALIEQLSDNCDFKPPAPNIAGVEMSLGIRLPAELKSLLKETNGVDDEFGFGLIWSAGRIGRDNLQFRQSASFKELYMPFDSLLFFADLGNGDQFGFTILAGDVRRPDIFVWNHENDSRSWIAASLERYLELRLKGKLEI